MTMMMMMTMMMVTMTMQILMMSWEETSQDQRAVATSPQPRPESLNKKRLSNPSPSLILIINHTDLDLGALHAEESKHGEDGQQGGRRVRDDVRQGVVAVDKDSIELFSPNREQSRDIPKSYKCRYRRSGEKKQNKQVQHVGFCGLYDTYIESLMPFFLPFFHVCQISNQQL